MTSGSAKNLSLLCTALALLMGTGQGLCSQAVDTVSSSPELLSGFLYFGDGSGRYLSSVEHRFPQNLSPHELAVALINRLIQDPPQGLSRTLPRETRLNALFIDREGNAYIDLDDTITNKLPGGAEAELLAIYSIVNSLVLNIPEIKQIKFLIQGTDARTFTGHMDLDDFFKANMLIIR
ncbi:MAG: GerMN domain-containing protein [Pseudomonadota bacterium]